MGNFDLDGVKGLGVSEFGLNPKYFDIKNAKISLWIIQKYLFIIIL